MNTAPISFKGLNYENVIASERKFVKQDFKLLRELGRSYDIKLVSTYAKVPKLSAIDVDVKPLSDSIGFFKWLFSPVGRSTFYTEFENTSKDAEPRLVDSVKNAINDLNKKLQK